MSDRLRTPPKRARRRSPLGNLKAVDGLAHGAKYRNNYLCYPAEFLHAPGRANVKQPAQRRPPKLALSDFECVKVIGQGECSKVLLVRLTRSAHEHDGSGSYFALRVCDKKRIRSLEPASVPLTSKPPERDVERSILSRMAWNPFVSNVIDAFHDTRNIYTLLEDIPCGTLRSLIQDKGPLDVATATFYYANIASALSFLQKSDIVHRNLNPDTVLVGTDGYLCLSDFTKATIPSDDQGFRHWLFVGILAYMAPECVNPAAIGPLSYGSTIDWWSSGCIFFELIASEPAFLAADGTEISTAARILSGEVNWPINLRIGKNIKSVVESLLVLRPHDRLGFKGFQQVFQHPYFEKIDWGMVENRLYIAPYVPLSPHAADEWHKYPLPRRSQVPGLRVATPSILLAHDERFAFRLQ